MERSIFPLCLQMEPRPGPGGACAGRARTCLRPAITAWNANQGAPGPSCFGGGFARNCAQVSVACTSRLCRTQRWTKGLTM